MFRRIAFRFKNVPEYFFSQSETVVFWRENVYNKDMKQFRYRFPKWIIALLAVGAALCVGAAIYDVALFVLSGATDVLDWIKYLLFLFAALLLAVVFLSVLLSTKYLVSGGALVLRFGIVRNKYSLADVNSLHLFKSSKKLFVYFKNEQYAVVNVNGEWADALVRAIVEENENITYSFSSPEEEELLKNKDKKGK